MAIKSLHVLFSGWQANVEKEYFTFRQNRGEKIASSFLCFLIKTDTGNILVDTGVHPDEAAEMAKVTGDEIKINSKDFLPANLESLGTSLKEINTVIMTHLHWDHAGWLNHIPSANVIVQKEEYRFALEPPPYASNFYLPTNYHSGLTWKLIDGDHIFMPGITLIFTPGHTPGSQSVMVDLPDSGTILITGDAGFLQENFEKEFIPICFGNTRQALVSIRRLNIWSKARKAPLFTTHDMAYWNQKMKKSPEAYT